MKKQMIYGLLLIAGCPLSTYTKGAKPSISLNSSDAARVAVVSSDNQKMSVDRALASLHDTNADRELEAQITKLKHFSSQKNSVVNVLDDAINQLADSRIVQPEPRKPMQQAIAPTTKSAVKVAMSDKNMTPNIQAAVDVITLEPKHEQVKEFIPLKQSGEFVKELQTDKVVIASASEPIICDREEVKRVRPRAMNVGCGNQYTYIDDEDCPKNWVVPASVYNTFCLDTAFNNCKAQVPMAQVIFGVPSFTIGDVFLLSRLAYDNILYITTPGATIAADSTQVGNQEDLQFLSLLAPLQLNFDADAYELGADLSFIYRFNFGKCIDVVCSIGLTIPVLCRTHELDLQIIGSNLYDTVAYAAQDTTVREDTITQFFNNFISVEDFFARAVLAPKGLTYERKQQAMGFGDISLFTTFDFAPSVDYVDGLQVGLNLSFPTASKATGDKIWEVQLGSGALQLDLLGNVIFNGCSKYFNPTIYVAGNFNFPFTANLRVPAVVSHVAAQNYNDPSDILASGVTGDLKPNIPGLVVPGVPNTPVVPPIFASYYTLSFSQPDSNVLYFADNVNDTRVKKGSRVIAGFGNYFYASDSCELRLGIFYDFTAQAADNLCVYNCSEGFVPTQFNTSLFECLPSYAQRISWHAAYKLGSCGEVMIGSQHVVAGRNTFKTNEAFATFVATF